VAALIASQAEDTIYTTAFSRSWPDAPHRVLRSCVTAAEAFQGDTVSEMTALDGTRMPALRLATFGVDKAAAGTIAAMSLFAGESVGAVTQVESAAEILRKFVDECVRSAHRTAGVDQRSALGELSAFWRRLREGRDTL
jgi:nitronate monooxygenase